MSKEDPRSGCARVRARIPVLVDGGLSPLEEARDDGHLEACRDCRAELESHRCLLEKIRAASEPSALEVRRAEREALEGLPAGGPGGVSGARWWASPGWAAAVLFACAWWITAGAGLRPAPLEIAGLHPVLERIPDWSAAWDGLGHLSRWLAGGMQ